MLRPQCEEYNAYKTMHIRQCIWDNAYKTIHIIEYMEYNIDYIA